MKSILHVVNISFVIPYFLGDQLIYYQKKGYDIHIICSPSEVLGMYAKDLKFTYKEIPILRKINLIQDLISVWRIFRYIKQNQINIVCGHTPKGGLLAMVASCMAKIPDRIYFRHGLVYETSRGLKRYLMILIERLTSMLSTKIVCVSPSICKRSLEDHLNSSEKQILLANGTCNGINIVRFDRKNISSVKLRKYRDLWGIKKNSFVIGYTGRLVKDKGVVELIQAFQIIRESYPNVVLLLIGMFEKRNALPLEIVEAIKRYPDIIYTGYVDNRVIEYGYALMNIFVLPSYREGFPTSILEASAMEVPVITTKVTGCVDAIIPNKTGLFVRHDSNDLANTIISLMKNPKQRAYLGYNGRLFVDSYFEQHIVWQEIEKLYQ